MLLGGFINNTKKTIIPAQEERRSTQISKLKKARSTFTCFAKYILPLHLPFTAEKKTSLGFNLKAVFTLIRWAVGREEH